MVKYKGQLQEADAAFEAWWQLMNPSGNSSEMEEIKEIVLAGFWAGIAHELGELDGVNVDFLAEETEKETADAARN